MDMTTLLIASFFVGTGLGSIALWIILAAR
jgi:hypothetical protein